MDSQPPDDPVAFVNAAEEILLRLRQVARRIQERVRKVLGGAPERKPPPDTPPAAERPG
jgi:hypothetical protein